MTPGLRAIATADLQDVVQAIVARRLRCPLTSSDLQAAGFGHIAELAEVLSGLDAPGAERALSLVITERLCREVPRLELVWTGPEPRISESRDTAVVVRHLFEDARESVIVAGFSFDHGDDIFRPLHAAMRDHGVTTDVFLEIPEKARGHEGCAADVVDAFFRKNWPFGDPKPTVYYDPRTAERGSHASLHAKCIVVDDQKALITSANFTNRGHTRNIETGVLIEDAAFASRLAGQWRGLVDAGLMTRF